MKHRAVIAILILTMAAVLAVPYMLQFAGEGAGGAGGVSGISGAGGVSGAGNDYSHDNLIRLHIIANSDDPGDQALKYKVRDCLVTALRPELRQLHSRAEAQALLTAEQGRIVSIAEQAIRAGGCSYPARMEIGDFAFPTRAYGNLVLPAGTYRAVRIVLGRGAGANWWCVLYPPLCFVDAAGSGIPIGAAPGCPALDSECRVESRVGSSVMLSGSGGKIPAGGLAGTGGAPAGGLAGTGGAPAGGLTTGSDARQKANLATPQAETSLAAAGGLQLRLRLIEWLQSESLQIARLFDS
jgi:stage II sporulation protein R